MAKVKNCPDPNLILGHWDCHELGFGVSHGIGLGVGHEFVPVVGHGVCLSVCLDSFLGWSLPDIILLKCLKH